MSTHALIGIQNTNDTITYIYNHYDGYVKGLGHMLRKFFKTEAAVRALLAYGDIASIYTDEQCAWLIKRYPDMYKRNMFQTVQHGVIGCKVLPLTPYTPHNMCNQSDYSTTVCAAYVYLFVPTENRWYYTKGQQWKPVRT